MQLKLNLKPTDQETIPNNLNEPLLFKQPSLPNLERRISTTQNHSMNLSITHRRKDLISLGMNANIEIIPDTTYPTSP